MSDPTSTDPGDDSLFTRVFAELRQIARHSMLGERQDHTLQATALVNEAWLRLRDQVGEARDNPGRFYAAAAESMRRILIEHSRRRGRQKRGGGLHKLPLDLATVAESADLEQILAIDSAIESLAAVNPRAAGLVRLRFFAGLTEVAAAAVLGISERTVRREWTFARAWLYDALSR
ncbi:MAG: ECF-type sigma factor [Planctomycetota bacterium]